MPRLASKAWPISRPTCAEHRRQLRWRQLLHGGVREDQRHPELIGAVDLPCHRSQRRELDPRALAFAVLCFSSLAAAATVAVASGGGRRAAGGGTCRLWCCLLCCFALRCARSRRLRPRRRQLARLQRPHLLQGRDCQQRVGERGFSQSRPSSCCDKPLSAARAGCGRGRKYMQAGVGTEREGPRRTCRMASRSSNARQLASDCSATSARSTAARSSSAAALAACRGRQEQMVWLGQRMVGDACRRQVCAHVPLQAR